MIEHLKLDIEYYSFLCVCWPLVKHARRLLAFLKPYIFQCHYTCVAFTEFSNVFRVSKSNHIKYGGQTKAYEFWDIRIREELALLGVKIREERFRKRQKVVLCLAAILVISNITGTLLLMVDIFGTGFGLAFTAPF